MSKYFYYCDTHDLALNDKKIEGQECSQLKLHQSMGCSIFRGTLKQLQTAKKLKAYLPKLKKILQRIGLYSIFVLFILFSPTTKSAFASIQSDCGFYYYETSPYQYAGFSCSASNQITSFTINAPSSPDLRNYIFNPDNTGHYGLTGFNSSSPGSTCTVNTHDGTCTFGTSTNSNNISYPQIDNWGSGTFTGVTAELNGIGVNIYYGVPGGSPTPIATPENTPFPTPSIPNYPEGQTFFEVPLDSWLTVDGSETYRDNTMLQIGKNDDLFTAGLGMFKRPEDQPGQLPGDWTGASLIFKATPSDPLNLPWIGLSVNLLTSYGLSKPYQIASDCVSNCAGYSDAYNLEPINNLTQRATAFENAIPREYQLSPDVFNSIRKNWNSENYVVLALVDNLSSASNDYATVDTSHTYLRIYLGASLVQQHCSALDVPCIIGNWIAQFQYWLGAQFFAIQDFFNNTFLSLFTINPQYAIDKFNNIATESATRVPWVFTNVVLGLNLSDPPIASYDNSIPDFHFNGYTTKYFTNDNEQHTIELINPATISGQTFDWIKSTINDIRNILKALIYILLGIFILTLGYVLTQYL